jgi:hypothetical protein
MSKISAGKFSKKGWLPYSYFGAIIKELEKLNKVDLTP